MGKLHVYFLLLGACFAFYDDNGPVINLTNANFKTEVLDTDDIWLVEFYAPWCGHCKNLKPEWEKAAKGLAGYVRLGAVDMTTDREAGEPYDVQGFPTLLIFSGDKQSPKKYQGGRTAKDIAEAGIEELRLAAGKALGEKVNAGEKKPKPKADKVDEKDVVVLKDSTFDDEVMESEDLWLIEFYAPWCGHCKTLKPEWAKAATELAGQVKLAKVDCTKETELATRFGIRGYPTLKVFPPHAKSDPEDYEGPREADGIVRVAKKKMKEFGVEIPAQQKDEL